MIVSGQGGALQRLLPIFGYCFWSFWWQRMGAGPICPWRRPTSQRPTGRRIGSSRRPSHKRFQRPGRSGSERPAGLFPVLTSMTAIFPSLALEPPMFCRLSGKAIAVNSASCFPAPTQGWSVSTTLPVKASHRVASDLVKLATVAFCHLGEKAASEWGSSRSDCKPISRPEAKHQIAETAARQLERAFGYRAKRQSICQVLVLGYTPRNARKLPHALDRK